MEEHYNPGAVYNQTKFDKLVNCMADQDDLLVRSQEATWSKILDFWKRNGTEGDHWGETGNIVPWSRNTPEIFGKDGMIINEPCNYVSNMAYYHSVSRTCDYPNWSITQT